MTVRKATYDDIFSSVGYVIGDGIAQGCFDWYLKNHDKVKEFWLRVNRAAKPFPGVIGYVDAVEVALCFGWIDSTLKSIDSGKPVQRFTPRRKGSNWCTINVERCKRLIAQEEMTEYGLAVIPEGLLS